VAPPPVPGQYSGCSPETGKGMNMMNIYDECLNICDECLKRENKVKDESEERA
jgi:hypothetical protein